MESQFREIIRQKIVDALAAPAPALTRRDVRLPAVPRKALAAALADLRLDRLLVVHPGKVRFPLGKKIEALPLADCLREVAKLGGR